jgi:hypothetical protein
MPFPDIRLNSAVQGMGALRAEPVFGTVGGWVWPELVDSKRNSTEFNTRCLWRLAKRKMPQENATIAILFSFFASLHNRDRILFQFLILCY